MWSLCLQRSIACPGAKRRLTNAKLFRRIQATKAYRRAAVLLVHFFVPLCNGTTWNVSTHDTHGFNTLLLGMCPHVTYAGSNTLLLGMCPHATCGFLRPLSYCVRPQCNKIVPTGTSSATSCEVRVSFLCLIVSLNGNT